MSKFFYIWLFLAGAMAGTAEIIDRIAVVVDKMVITESDVVNHLRIASFLNGEPVSLTNEERREAANRLVEQLLVRREMEISRYPAPAPADVDPVLGEFRARRYPEEGSYKRALAEYGVSDADVRESLLLQLTLLRFIQFRFRPGVALDDSEVEAYYRNEFNTEWSSRNTTPPPPLDDVRDEIEEILIEAHVDEALDNWLEETTALARIRYIEEAFQ